MSAENTRRDFLKQAATGSIALIASASFASFLAACDSPTDSNSTAKLTGDKVNLNLSEQAGLSSVGGFIRQTFGNNNGGKPVLVVRTGSAEFKTMSTVCTHQGTIINNPSGNVAQCPNHGAQFSTNANNFGANVGGQSAGTLQTFVTTYDSATGVITINF